MRGVLPILELCAVTELQYIAYFKLCFWVSEFMNLATDLRHRL